ncbi:MAG: FeoB-associated Cys-rich membrane protein [Desulfosarcina sp.]
MQTLIVILIVVAAAVYVGWRIYKGLKQKDGCARGCTGCDISDSCGDPAAVHWRSASEARSDSRPISPRP